MRENFNKYDAETQKSLLKNICEGLDTTYALLEDLLLWSNSQNNPFDFKPEKINLSDITGTIIDIFSHSIKNKSLLINRNFPSSFYCQADKQMISTIIRNLLSNAIKFSNKHGHIEIGFSRFTEADIENVLVYVVDSGLGIPKEKIEKLFSIGEHISTPGTDNETGTGLGLVMCKEFIDKHKGTIAVDSKISRGTKITITLPQ